MKKLLILLIMSFALAACGGGGGSQPDPTPEPVVVQGCTDSTATNYNSEATVDDGSCQYPEPIVRSISGKAFDGYIVGGTAWLDINGNGELDEGEPSSITKAGGDYTIDMTATQEACLAWSTIYVDVPAGAIDEQEGEVLEPYRMSFPPSLDPDLEQDGINISPLTTVVWESVATSLRNSGTEISCETLSTDETLSNFIRFTIDNGMRRVVQHYNVPLDKIYSDFIADGDTELQAKAVEIVRGLQKSLSDTVEISKDYPGAAVQVQYYTGSGLENWVYADQWYKEVWIWESGQSRNVVTRVTEDFSEPVKLIMDHVTKKTIYETHSTESHIVYQSREDDDVYECEVSDTLYWTYDSKEMTIGNIRFLRGADSAEACVALKEQNINTQNVFVRYYDSDITYRTQYNYRTALFDTTVNPETVTDYDLERWGNLINISPYRYIDRGMNGADFVVRTKIETIDDETDIAKIQTMVMQRQNDLTYSRFVYLDDGTSQRECSADGTTWGTCS